MNSINVKNRPHHLKLNVALAILFTLMLVVFTLGRAKADGLEANASTSAPLGGWVSLSGTGFTPGERINLWTTDPSGQALDAGYIFADNQGNFALRVDSFDPNGMGATGNFTTLTDNYDADGNITSEYWETILKDNPLPGSWSITANGTSSSVLTVYGFSFNK